MKVVVTAASAVVLAALLLSGCSGDDQDPASGGKNSSGVSGASSQTGGRATAEASLADATIEVKDGALWFVGTVTNSSDSDLTLQSVYVNGFKLAETGELKDGQVVRPGDGIELKKGASLTFGTTGHVVRLAVPDAEHKAGTKMRVNVNFTNDSQIVQDATLSEDIAP